MENQINRFKLSDKANALHSGYPHTRTKSSKGGGGGPEGEGGGRMLQMDGLFNGNPENQREVTASVCLGMIRGCCCR